MREFGKEMTPEQVALASTTALQPFNPPTVKVPVPTPEEMANWYPDEAPEKMRWRKSVNVQTGEVIYTELSLEEYRERHVNKIISRNEWLDNEAAKAAKAQHDADMEQMLAEWRAAKGQ